MTIDGLDLDDTNYDSNWEQKLSEDKPAIWNGREVVVEKKAFQLPAVFGMGKCPKSWHGHLSAGITANSKGPKAHGGWHHSNGKVGLSFKGHIDPNGKGKGDLRGWINY